MEVRPIIGNGLDGSRLVICSCSGNNIRINKSLCLLAPQQFVYLLPNNIDVHTTCLGPVPNHKETDFNRDHKKMCYGNILCWYDSLILNNPQLHVCIYRTTFHFEYQTEPSELKLAFFLSKSLIIHSFMTTTAIRHPKKSTLLRVFF